MFRVCLKHLHNAHPKSTIKQVFEAHPKHDTTLMLDVYNNSIVCHNNSALVPNIRDTCFQSNVIHDVEASSVNIYVDGVQVYETPS